MRELARSLPELCETFVSFATVLSSALDSLPGRSKYIFVMRYPLFVLSACILLFVTACSGGRIDSNAAAWSANATGGPLVIAHRGYSAVAPENTAVAIEQGIQAGADLIEIDVQMASDGGLVVIHDTTLSRTTDAPLRYPLRPPWNVADFTQAEILALDAGSWFGVSEDPGNFSYRAEPVPDLLSVLMLLKDRAGLLLEVKSPALYPGIEALIAKDLEQAGWVVDGAATQHLVVQSFDWDSMARYAALHPEVPIGLLGNPPQDEAGWQAIGHFADYINPSHSVVDAALVDEVHRRGLAITPYTVNEVARMRELMAMGIDGIITDEPLRLHALARGGAVASGEFTLDSTAITELSGIAYSQKIPGVYWGHNDSGDSARVFAFDGAGRDLGALSLPGAFALDWEDMASFSSAGQAWLLLADVGDNDALRRSVRLHILAEPSAPPYSGSVRDYRSISLRYPDGPRDCEAVAVDAEQGLIYLLSKRDPYPRLYSVPLYPSQTGVQVAEFVGEITSLPLPASGELAAVGEITNVSPTAMDFSPDGRAALIVTLEHSYRYQRAAGQSWFEALNQPPQTLEVPDYPQIEAGTFSGQGQAVLIGSEGSPAALYASPD